MPFTPFHCGPGLAIKSIFPKWFSLIIFTGVQILIDIESLYNLINQTRPVHGFFHSYIGATLVALVGGGIAYFIFRPVFRLWNIIHRRGVRSRLHVNPLISLKSAMFSALIAAYTHVFLDSIMHSDVKPFYPMTDANFMHNVLGDLLLYLLCVVLGIIGLVFWGTYFMSEHD